MPSPLNTPTGENMTIQQLFGKAGPKVESGGSDQPSWSLPSSATTPNLSMFCGNPEPKPQVLTKRKHRPACLNLSPTFELDEKSDKVDDKLVATLTEATPFGLDLNALAMDVLEHNAGQSSMFSYILQHHLSLEPVKINPALSLEEQDWYHGMINRAEAERSLADAAVGSYLVRRLECRRCFYSLALKSLRGYMHIRIFFNHQLKQFTLGTACDQGFDTIPAMIDHFGANRLSIPGAQHMSLLYPVAVQLL